MDHQMLDLLNVCRELGSEKKKDRTSAATKLKNFLNHAGVKKALDKNYEQKQAGKSTSKILTWENVFKAACIYLNLETEEVKQAKDNVSRATLTRRETKTQEAISILKHVIRTADKGGPKLKGSSVFDYIADSMRDEYMCQTYGPDFCSILVRNILSTRKYVVELFSQQWHDMLSLMFKLFNDASVKIDQLLMSRLIHALICGITSQVDVKPKKILNFFNAFFVNVKQYKSPVMVQQMIMSMNMFIRVMAPSSRVQICKLGEDVFPYVLYVWHSMADQIKDEVIEFIQIQISAHHPRGDKQGHVAAFAVDWDKWMSNLRKVYEIMYNEIQQIGNRNRSKEYMLKQPFVDLAVDVCQQLFSDSSHAIEVTQMSYDSGDGPSGPGSKKRRLESGWASIRDFMTAAGQNLKLVSDIGPSWSSCLVWRQKASIYWNGYSSHTIEATQVSYDSGDGPSGPGSKKRRLESGWASIRDFMTAAGQNLKLVPWLQLVTRLMQKYPSSLPSEEIVPYLNCIASLLSDCKRSDVMVPILTCCEAFVHCWSVLVPQLSTDHTEMCKHIWMRIWKDSLRFLSLHHSESAGYKLLSAIIKKGLVLPARDIWCLFIPTVCSPVSESVKFLYTYLQHCDLPETHVEKHVSVENRNVKDLRFPLRKQLIDWLLPAREVDEEGNKSKCKTFPDWTAHVLFMLMLRNPSAFINENITQKQENLSDLEKWYLRNVMELPLEVEEAISCHGNKVTEKEVVHIPLLMNEIENLFYRDVQYFCRLNEIEVSDIEDMVDYARLLLTMISHQLQYKLLTTNTLANGNCFELLGKIMKKLSTATLDQVKKHGHGSVKSVIVKLQDLYMWAGNDKETSCKVGNVCRAVTPSRLIDLLMDICKEKNIKAPNHENDSNNMNHSRYGGTTSNGSRVRILDDFDDFGDDSMDLEFDGASNRNNNNMDIEDDFSESQEADDHNTAEVFKSLLSAAILQDTHILKLESVKSLCNWCSYSGSTNTNQQLKSEVDVCYIRSKLIKLLEEGSFDPNRPADIQMMMIIINKMTDSTSLTENEKCIMVEAVRNLVKYHRKDQEICRRGLDMLIKLVPHLQDNNEAGSSVLKECRESFLHLVNVFWKLQEDNSFSSEVRQGLVILFERLIEVDPGCVWSRFPCDSDSDSIGDGPTPSSRLIDSYRDYCHLVRMCAVQATHRLFLYKRGPDLKHFDRQEQERMFEQLYEVLCDSLDIQGRLSEDRLQDETSNRVTGVLTCLASVICSSPVCEKKAVFTALKIMKEKNIPVERVQQMINKVAGILGYRGPEKFIEDHLPFILNKWLSVDFNIEHFPFQLCGCASLEQFYRSYIQTIIPELVNKRDIETIKSVCGILQVDVTTALKQCIPYIVTHILPLFAASKLVEYKTDESIRRRTTKATNSYNFLVEQLTEEVTEREIVSNLDTIVVNIMCCLYDDGAGRDEIYSIQPDPNPPSYSPHLISATLEYLTKSFSGSGKSLVEILAKSTDSIQNILLQLAVKLSQSHRLMEKYRILQIYSLFCKLLLKHFHTQLGGVWAFVLRELITRLVYLLQDMQNVDVSGGFACVQENILMSTCQILQDNCSEGVNTCAGELKKYLPLLVSNLIPLVKCPGQIGERFLILLRYLILEKASNLQTAIVTLDEFPNNPVFREFRSMHHKLKYAHGPFSLQQEVEHFLNTGHNYSVLPEFRLEGLKFLHTKLVTETDSLKLLTKDGVLSKLICELVYLAKGSNKDVALEAGKCLGLIGPINLNTISLPKQQPNKGLELALDIFQNTELEKYCRVFHCLKGYLADKSMELVQCTSDVLKAVLAVKTGSEFCMEYKGRLGESEFLFHYLHPFRPKKKGSQTTTKKETGSFTASVDQETLWNPHHLDHKLWIVKLTTSLIDSGSVKDEILKLLGPVCAMKHEFCELILPYLIHDILKWDYDNLAEVLSRQINNFFTCHCGQSSIHVKRSHSVTSMSVPTGDEYICMNIDSVRTMIEVIQYLRQQQRPKVGRKEMTIWDNNFWLDIDYLQVAMAAQYCSSHFTTMLYAEIWCDVQREKEAPTGSRGSQSLRGSQGFSQETRIDTLSEASTSQSCVSIQDLLLDAYRWIGDPDGVYGCGAGRKADMSSRICTYQQENQWDKAVISCDIQMDQSASSAQYDLLHALQNFGTSHILDAYLQGIMGRDDTLGMTSEIRELQYEAAWRIGQWNLDTSNKITDVTGYNESIYKSLRAIRDVDFVSGADALQHARLCSIACLKEGCLDSARRLYPVLANLQCTSIVENSAKLLQSANVLNEGQFDSQLDYDNDFDFVLPILYTHCTSLNLMWEKSKHRQTFDSYVNSLHKLATTARENGRHQICERAVNMLKMLEISDLSLSLPVQVEEARLYWCRGEQNVAKYLLRSVIDKVKRLKNEDQVAAKFYPQVLSIYGNWLAETRSENPTVIMEKYLEKTVELFEQLGEDAHMSMDAYLSLGRYADTQYQNIVNYMKSSTYEAKISLMEKAQIEAERLREVMGEQAKDRYLRTLEKQGEIDKNELETMEEDKVRFLLTAVQNYLQCLRCGDAHNLRIFRLTSLWFSNADSEEVNQLMEMGMSEIQTYKWIPLMYQLAARMDIKPQSNTSQQFLTILNEIIQRTAVDHPHHTLFCILALANANRDNDLIQIGRSSKRSGKLSSKSQTEGEKEEGRVQAAKNMVELLREDEKVGCVMADLQKLCDAYIQLANFNVSQHKAETKAIQLPAAMWLSNVIDLKNVPVPTREIPVDKSCEYKNISYIRKFEPTFKLAGGINLPKIISCQGSDGKSSRQLVKGKDDLRQDAIMQQVFDMVNNLLEKDNETRKRCLQIRKYKVIPLSQRSGLLEWCEGTQPIGEYLIGSSHSSIKGAHVRYRPQDMTAFQCRKHLSEARSSEGKLKAYMEICAKFQPVFRHFLMEKFTEPALWFERRLSYTRSVATNSIVGYILGLGDRHVQNILIDCNTAELVHIDLGVAFEQGEILPTPETVPFRLTRDIEDAMGPSGVEGVYRRCCEKTMEVMRNNQEALLTILEVLLHDPLHAWTISPAKAYALQQRGDKNINQDTLDVTNTTGDIMDMAENTAPSSASTQENKNKLAERVLLRLREKLQGIEDGVQLSLLGQVNHLIQEARNPKNLARLFPGWQPYI